MVRCDSILAIWLCLLAGCSAEVTPRTELLLVADTDIARLSSITFEIDGPDARHESASAEAGPSAPGPRSLGVLYTGGKLGPFVLKATGFDATRNFIVSRTARTSFVKGKTLIVPLHLVQSCVNFACPAQGDTCTERGCEPVELAAGDLAVWSGRVPGLSSGQPEGGTSGGDGAAGSPEAGSDRDAGGSTGGGSSGPADAATDASQPPVDAGLDGGAPPPDSGTPVDSGTPADAGPACSATQVDCDPNVPGCETDLQHDRFNCGMCGMKCVGLRTCLPPGVCYK